MLQKKVSSLLEDVFPKQMLEVAKKIRKKGGELALVGGAVRDAVISVSFGGGYTPKDFDFVIAGMTESNFQDLFPESKKVGKQFPVYLLFGHEVAFARKEKRVDGRWEIDFSPETTLEEDSIRRDFACNSLLYLPQKNSIIDYCGGIDQIQKGLIDVTSEFGFRDDPSRILRGARFAAKYNFSLAARTRQLMKQMKDLTADVQKELIFEEMRKALLGKKPSRFFEVLEEVGVLEIVFPTIKKLVGQSQPAKYHPEGDAFKHFLQVLDSMAEICRRFGVNPETRSEWMFAALAHDLGKGLTPEKELPHHYNHHRTGVDALSQMAENHRLPKRWRKVGRSAIRLHMKAHQWKKMKAKTLVKFLVDTDNSLLGLDGLLALAQADHRGRNNIEGLGDNLGVYQDLLVLGQRMLDSVHGGNITPPKNPRDFGKALRRARVDWMKNHRPSYM